MTGFSVVICGFWGSGIVPVIFSVVSRLIGRMIAARAAANHFLLAFNSKVGTTNTIIWQTIFKKFLNF